METSETSRRAIILAGGAGTRVRDLYPGLPKPMFPVAGRPFLEWVIRYLVCNGVRQIVISTGVGAPIVREYARNFHLPGVSIGTSHETSPLGTGGALLRAMRSASGDRDARSWLVCNGDSLFFADFNPLYSSLVSGVDVAILGLSVLDASRYGTLTLCGSRLSSFSEKRRGAGIVNGGIYLIKERVLSGFPDDVPLSLEKDVFPKLLNDVVPIEVVVAEGEFLDIGTPDSFRMADEFVRLNQSKFQ